MAETKKIINEGGVPEKNDRMGSPRNENGNAEEQRGGGLINLWQEIRELSLGTTTQVERIRGAPSPLHFLREFVMPNRPCIITHGLEHWTALTKWTNDYLSSVLRDQQVSVHFTPNGRADSLIDAIPSDHRELLMNKKHWFVSAHVEQMPFPTALEYIAGSRSRERGVAYAQQQNGCFLSEYGLLAEDAEVDIPWATEALGSKPEAVNIWIGNERASTSFHKDHYENLYAVVCGEKHFTLLPPTDVHRMYIEDYPAAHYALSMETGKFDIELDKPLRYVPWSGVDPYPATLQAEQARFAFPRYFNGPQPFQCTVRAGEMLYLPSLWFHHVRQTPDIEGRTIAINFWYDMQFDIKYAYFNFLQSLRCPSWDYFATCRQAQC